MALVLDSLVPQDTADRDSGQKDKDLPAASSAGSPGTNPYPASSA